MKLGKFCFSDPNHMDNNIYRVHWHKLNSMSNNIDRPCWRGEDEFKNQVLWSRSSHPYLPVPIMFQFQQLWCWAKETVSPWGLVHPSSRRFKTRTANSLRVRCSKEFVSGNGKKGRTSTYHFSCSCHVRSICLKTLYGILWMRGYSGLRKNFGTRGCHKFQLLLHYRIANPEAKRPFAVIW